MKSRLTKCIIGRFAESTPGGHLHVDDGVFQLDQSAVDRRGLPHSLLLLSFLVLLLQLRSAQMMHDASAVRVAEHVH